MMEPRGTFFTVESRMFISWYVFFFSSRCLIVEDNIQLDKYYASLLGATSSKWNDVSFSDSEGHGEGVDDAQNQPSLAIAEEKDIEKIVTDLAKEIDETRISKFNISRTFLWEGTRRALSRKSFSSANKVSVKFTDDNGISEGAVDLGGPMREFFTLILDHLHTSHVCAI